MEIKTDVTVQPADIAADAAVENVRLGYSASLSGDSALFAASLSKVAESQAVDAVATDNMVMEAIVEPLDYINGEAKALIEYAENAVRSGDELTPSEIVMLTAKSQEFMFHSQLTSNVANRTADGLQQLFRQQS